MNTIKKSEVINYDRRRFLGIAAMSVAGAGLGMVGSASAQSKNTNAARATSTKRGTNSSSDSLKQIDAGLLNVSYAEAGPAAGPAVYSG